MRTITYLLAMIGGLYLILVITNAAMSALNI
jgi:hypothetical protein